MAINQTATAMFVSIPAAARELRVSVKRLKLALDLGQIASITLGRRKVIPRRTIERLRNLE